MPSKDRQSPSAGERFLMRFVAVLGAGLIALVVVGLAQWAVR